MLNREFRPPGARLRWEGADPLKSIDVREYASVHDGLTRLTRAHRRRPPTRLDRR
jgi:hypothetical protein